MVRRPFSYNDALVAEHLADRDREREILLDHLHRVESGNGGLILLSGEAGVGKTRLVQEIVSAANVRGAGVATGHCYDLTSTPPFAPWVDVLNGLVQQPRMPNALAQLVEGGEREAWAQGDDLTTTFIRYFDRFAKDRVLVIVLEDLHWADSASLDLLRTMARNLGEHAILLIGTYRDDELTSDHYLAELLPRIARESHAYRMTLQGLDWHAARDIVQHRYTLNSDDLDRVTSYVTRLSNGNPFFIHELLHALEDEQILQPGDDHWTLGTLQIPVVPPLVQQIVEGRLARIDPAARHALDVAAVIGQEFTPELWRTAAEIDEEALVAITEEALKHRILFERPDRGVLQFSHALVCEALYRGIVLPKRKMMHRHIAEVLRTAPSPTPSLIAHHYGQANDPRALDWMIRAARRANALDAPGTAMQTIDRVFELAAQFDLPLSTEVYAIRGQARSVVGDYEGARDDFQRVLQAASTEDDFEWGGHPWIPLGMIWAGQDSEKVDRYLRKALQFARESGDAQKLTRSLNRIGNWHLNVCKPGEALRFHHEALSLAQSLDDSDAEVLTLELLGMTYMILGDLVQAARYYLQVANMFSAMGQQYPLSISLSNLVSCAGSLATDTNVTAHVDVDDLLRENGPILHPTQEHGWLRGETYGSVMISLGLAYRGEFGRALAIMQRAAELANQMGHRQLAIHAQWRTAILHLELLNPEQALRLLEHALHASRELKVLIHERAAVGLLAQTQVRLGQLESAAETLTQTNALNRKAPETNQDRYAWCAAIELNLASGAYEQALRTVDRLLAATPHINDECGVPKLAILRARALTGMSRLDEAASELELARRHAREQRARALSWRIESDLAHVYAESGREAEAEEAADSARESIARLAATIEDETLQECFHSRAIATLPAHGAHAAADTGDERSHGLTEREIEVLQLVAEGLSDAEVAERLFISPRTVNAHMRSIYRKLDVSSRVAATRIAMEDQII